MGNEPQAFSIGHFLLDFLFAVVTGVVAGWIAGWMIMRSQFSTELQLDDAKRLLTMLHSLEDAAVNLNDAAFNEISAAQDGRDTKATYAILTRRIEEAMEVVNKVRVQAQFLRAKKYKLLKAYMVLRIKRGADWDWDEFILMRVLKELAEDINEYVNQPSFFKRMLHPRKDTLSKEQKEILKKSTAFRDVKPWWNLIGSRSPKTVEAYEVNKAKRAIEDLVGRGLLLEDNLEYQLTRAGWKEAVRLMDGEYDSQAGPTIPLT
jgi:hypothetical protein